MWVQFERHLHARNLWLGLHPWRWLVARMEMMTMCCCASEINVMASLALFHSLVKSVTPWGLKESLPCVDILTENFSHVRVKKTKRLYLFQILRGKNAYESDVLVFSLPFSIDSSLNQFFLFIGKYLCAFRGHWVREQYGAIEITSKYFPLSCS